MTDLFTNRTSDYDGSPTGDDDVQTATGSVIVSLTGTLGDDDAIPVLVVYSRTPSAVDYDKTYVQQGLGRQAIDLANGDQYYCKVFNVNANMSLDLSVVNVA